MYCSGDIGAVPGTDWELAKGTIKDRAVRRIYQCPQRTLGKSFTRASFNSFLTGASSQEPDRDFGNGRKQPRECLQGNRLHHHDGKLWPRQRSLRPVLHLGAKAGTLATCYFVFWKLLISWNRLDAALPCGSYRLEQMLRLSAWRTLTGPNRQRYDFTSCEH